MTLQAKKIEQLSNLFLSVKDQNIALAFAILDQQTLPKSLITEVFAVYLLTENSELRLKAEQLLKKHRVQLLSNATQWRSKLKDAATTEKTVAQNIEQYCDGQELIGSKLAKALFRKLGLGSYYLLNRVGEEERKQNILTFVDGSAFRLHNAGLQTFPPELFELTELSDIDLSGNKIKSIPAKIKVFQNLRVLRLSGNQLKKINKAILELKKLEELYLNSNLMTAFPEILTAMHWLKKLDITGLTTINMYRGLELPVEQLKKMSSLQAIGLANYNKTSSELRFYSPYRNYPHLTWVEKKDKALNLEPLALAKTAYLLNGESVSFILRYSKDADFKIKVLSGFYDPKQKRMDFKGTYLEYLPEELTAFDIRELDLSNSSIGLAGSHFKTPEEMKKGYVQVDKERLSVIHQLTQLQVLVLDYCALTAFPDGLEQLRSLRILRARCNYIRNIPKSIGQLSQLELVDFWACFSHFEDQDPQIPANFRGLTQLKKIHFHFCGMDTTLYKSRLKAVLPQNCILDLEN